MEEEQSKMDCNEAKFKEKQNITYNGDYSDLLVKEQPYYRNGMTSEEIKKEDDYLKENLKDFFEGRYMPLWKQEWFR